MAIDRLDWHAETVEEADLPYENSGTHIGMYLAWMIMHHLEGEIHQEDSESELDSVRNRQMTGRTFLINVCDEKFCDEDLSDEGYAFTQAYYETDQYSNDYDEILVLPEGLSSSYAVADTWENYDLIAAKITQRYTEWKKNQS